ncbi:hypothetical protein [Faecalimicrobium sp. JNUCC 81]
MNTVDSLLEVRNTLNNHLKIASEFQEEYEKSLLDNKEDKIIASIRKADIRYCEGMKVIARSTIKKIDEILENEISTGVREIPFDDLPISIHG